MKLETDLRFNVPLWLTQEAIRPLVQFTRRRLLYPGVTVLVAPHLLAYVLVYRQQKDRMKDRMYADTYAGLLSVCPSVYYTDIL